MGTPGFAVHILEKMLQENHNVVGVVTAPDKPAGRGQRTHSSAVKKFALKQDLKIYQPTNLKSDDFQQTLAEINPDLAVVVAFRMLPKKVWNFPKFGTFNLHASLLPDYRGAAPINWAIINGETKTGVTTFFLDERIDTGKIILQKETTINAEETAGSLHDKLMEDGAKLVNQTIELIAKNKVEAKAQKDFNPQKNAPKLNAENTKIDWSKNPTEIYNLVRGLNPYPVAWTYFKNGEKKLRCKIFAVQAENTTHENPIGKVFKTKNELKVAVSSGYIKILEMQMPGKRKMLIKDILNGLNLKENAFML